MLKNKANIDVFNSGKLQICIKQEKRVKENLINGLLDFQEKTIGISRFYNARVASSSISKLVAIPYQNAVNVDDRDKYVVLIDGVWYDVDFIQVKFDKVIPQMLLTLKKGGINYIDER